jgi:hypothetical protein
MLFVTAFRLHDYRNSQIRVEINIPFILGHSMSTKMLVLHQSGVGSGGKRELD